jgi:acetolactate synthase small subunit
MQINHVMFIIETQNRAEVLTRIVVLFHRLNVEIYALSMMRRRGLETMQLRLTIETEPEHARRIEAHLHKIVEVRSVETRAQPSEAEVHERIHRPKLP